MGNANIYGSKLHALADDLRQRGHFVNITTIGHREAKLLFVRNARQAHNERTDSKLPFDSNSVDTR